MEAFIDNRHIKPVWPQQVTWHYQHQMVLTYEAYANDNIGGGHREEEHFDELLRQWQTI